MEEEVESAEKSGENNIYENNLVLCPLFRRAWKDQVDDSSEDEADQAGKSNNPQDIFFKIFLLLLGGSRQARIMIRAVSHASHYHFGNLSRAPFYQVVDAERVDHFAGSFVPFVPFFLHNLKPPIISCSELVVSCLANL